VTEYSTGNEVASVPHDSAILALAFHPHNSSTLLTGAMDGTHKIIDCTNKPQPKVIQVFKDHTKYVVRVAWHPSGDMFATCSYDHSVCLYAKNDNLYALKKRFYYSANVEAIAFTPDGQTLIIAVREDNYLHYIDPNTLEEEKYNMNQNLDDHVSFNALDLSIHPHGNYLLVATDKHRVIMFRTGTSDQVRNFYGMVNDSYSQPRVAWHPSGHYVYCTSQEKTIHVYSVATEKLIHKNQDHVATVRDLSHHPSENLLASCSYDKTVKLWKP